MGYPARCWPSVHSRWGGRGPFYYRLTKLARRYKCFTLHSSCHLRHAVLAVMIVVAVAGYGACSGSYMIIVAVRMRNLAILAQALLGPSTLVLPARPIPRVGW